MWFLTCPAEHLDNKRIWLRPGSRHLFGRTHTENDGATFHAITNKSVSRKHFELKVGQVAAGSSTRLLDRSTITIIDDSKLGTRVDSEVVKKASKDITGDSFVIHLGNYNIPFHVKWEPIVFTFTGARSKDGTDRIADERTVLEAFDIKCIGEYVSKQTSHVVSDKRNTKEGLLALVEGKPIVTKDIIPAIVQAAARQPSSVPGAPPGSPLEEDFDANWPAEIDYLPAPGREPHPRPPNDKAFLKDEKRARMFEKYTFIFVDSSQHDQFLAVISKGSGKALLYDLAPPQDQPSLEDFLEYVKNCAGKKGDAAFRLSQHPADQGGVIVIRPTKVEQHGGQDFFVRLDIALDQRSIWQNEFLEAILLADASTLRRELEVDESAEVQPQRRQGSHPRQQSAFGGVEQSSSGALVQESSAPSEDAAPPTKKARRNFTRQKISTFDDFDPTRIIKYDAAAQEVSSQIPLQSVDGDEMEVDGGKASQLQRGRKRPAESQLQPVESTSQVLEGLLVGHAAMKKRRLAEAAKGETSIASGTRDAGPSQDMSQTKRKTEKEMNADLQQTISARREAEDALRREDENKLREALPDMEIEEIRNFAKVEDMEVKPRAGANGHNGTSDAWRPEWNGRANWKTFKKRKPGQAQAEDDGPVMRKVIVPLEPYKASNSLDEDFWLQGSNRSGRYTSSTTKTPSTSQAVRRRNLDTLIASDPVELDDGDGEDAGTGSQTADLRRRIEKSRLDDAREDELTALDPEEIAGRPRDPEVARQLAQSRRDGKAAGGNAGTAGKRAQASGTAAAVAGAPVLGKRAREVQVVEDDEDDDDDGEGLRFRRRKRG